MSAGIFYFSFFPTWGKNFHVPLNFSLFSHTPEKIRVFRKKQEEVFGKKRRSSDDESETRKKKFLKEF